MRQLAIYVVVAIIADIVGKEIVTICMFLGIIITAVMQVPCNFIKQEYDEILAKIAFVLKV